MLSGIFHLSPRAFRMRPFVRFPRAVLRLAKFTASFRVGESLLSLDLLVNPLAFLLKPWPCGLSVVHFEPLTKPFRARISSRQSPLLSHLAFPHYVCKEIPPLRLTLLRGDFFPSPFFGLFASQPPAGPNFCLCSCQKNLALAYVMRCTFVRPIPTTSSWSLFFPPCFLNFWVSLGPLGSRKGPLS